MNFNMYFLRAFLLVLLVAFCGLSPVAGDKPPSIAEQGIEPTLIIDLDAEIREGSSTPQRFRHDADLDLTFFVATTATEGTELWSYDGAEAKQIADLCPGPCSSEPDLLASHGGKTFFVADDGDFGREIWSTDGTREGTKRLGDFCPGPCSSAGIEPQAAVYQGRVVFPVKTAEPRSGAVWDLWTSDGTPEGTSLFRSDACPLELRSLAAGTDTLYFKCNRELFAYRADSEKRTLLLGETVYFGGSVIGDEFFVRRYTEEHGVELWKSDGSPEGSVLVADFAPGPSNGIRRHYGVLGDHVYVTTEPSGSLYRVNSEGFEAVSSVEIDNLKIAEDRVFFGRSYFDFSAGEMRSELRTAQGPGTEQVLQNRSFRNYLYLSGTAGGNLFFKTEGELWISDGTVAGTRIVDDLSSVDVFVDSSTADVFTAISPQEIVFGASQDQGFELWTSEADIGAFQVADLEGPTPGSGKPTRLTPVDERLAFTKNGSEIWSTDGTPQGNVRIEDGPRLSLELFPYQVGAETRLLYSTLNPGIDDVRGVWSTDGEQTELLLGELFALQSVNPLGDGSFLLEAGGDHYDEFGAELWRTDLTEPGTEFLLDLSEGLGGGVLSPPRPPLGASIEDTEILHDRLIFAGRQTTWTREGIELWTSDGTVDGTVVLAPCGDPEEGADCPLPRELTPVRKNFIVFSAFDDDKGRELWRTDGTVGGTKRIKDLLPGAEGGSPHGFVRVGPSRVLFFARNASGGDSLWITTGSPNGTRKLLDLSIDGRPSFVMESKFVDDRLFFVLLNESTGAELWVSDGAIDRTGLVRELMPGPDSSFVRNLTAYGDLLLFTARDPENGLELWSSDGTAEGTVRLTDLAPGPASSAPEEIVVVGDAVYFRGDDGETGRELWVFKP